MSETKIFVPFGALVTGIEEEAFKRGMELGPDIISTDAGSTDSGPYYLGTGKAKYAPEVVKRDLEQMMTAAVPAGIPITIGTAGTCGSNQGVDDLANICKEIAKAHGYKIKVATIYSEQDAEVIKKKYRDGKVIAMQGALEITEEVFDECSHIVGLAGTEPFMEALQNGADIVICGRATDTAVIAAFPLMRGADPASCWHAAKTAECGCLCTTNLQGGGVFLTIDKKGFTVEATASNSSCTPYSVSAHMLYENADPIHLKEPGVQIDTSESVYTQLAGGCVRVEGTQIEKMPYTIKLEGSSPAGYQTISMVGVVDRDIMKHPEAWLNHMRQYVGDKIAKRGISEKDYHCNFKLYGYSAVNGTVPEDFTPNEIAVLLTVTAKTQELATKIAKIYNPYLLHFPVHTDRQLPSFAFPLSPAETERGLMYAFRLYHVVEVDEPLELFKITYENIGEEV